MKSLISITKTILPLSMHKHARSTYLTLRRTIEFLIFGSPLRENILRYILCAYYKSKIRREWFLSVEPPHFSDHISSSALFALDRSHYNPHLFYRAFYSSEIIQNNDLVLDIGCGDGFLTKKFFSFRAGHIDGIDIDPVAIQVAQKRFGASNIKYHLLNAATSDFPLTKYNVIIWDGAIGHFSPEDSAKLLEKIARSLETNGIFCGSESLGTEGSDHLQFFYSLDEILALLKPHFKFVQGKIATYNIGYENYVRTEAYWRCSNSEKMLQNSDWIKKICS